MRKTLGRVAVLAMCVLVASAALAGSITGRGAGQPALQTIFRIDTPAPGATVFGIVEVRGYVAGSARRGARHAARRRRAGARCRHQPAAPGREDEIRQVLRRGLPVRPGLHDLVPGLELHRRQPHARDQGDVLEQRRGGPRGPHRDGGHDHRTRRRSARSTARATRRSTGCRTTSPACSRSSAGRSTTPASASGSARPAATRPPTRPATSSPTSRSWWTAWSSARRSTRCRGPTWRTPTRTSRAPSSPGSR